MGKESPPDAALSVVLEFARAQQAGDPFAFRFMTQEYLLRSAGGGFDSSQLAFNEALLGDLAALRRSQSDPTLLPRLGALLRGFLAPLGWAQQEQRILAACQEQRRVILTFRSAAAELYALPWELLAIKATAQHLGELPEVLIRYEWPETLTICERPSPRPAGGQILLAWSAAAGEVPARQHQSAIESACRASISPASAQVAVLPRVSPRRLSETLAAAERDGNPISVLHLLCHGVAVGGTFGLALEADEHGSGPAVIDAGRLRQLLAPYASTLRLVVLAACDGSNPGALGNQLGSVAQALHRAGFAAVVASRYPLSVAGSISLTEELYCGLLVRSESLESALLSARHKLAQDPALLDWASLQLYARAADGDDSRPVVFRPYRGLAAFLPQDQSLYFGRRRDVERIVKLLTGGARLVSVVGASGSGKSSLVLAGVAPKLAEAYAGDGALRVCVVRPGPLPCQALAVALQADPAPQAGAAPAELGSRLLHHREALAEFAAADGCGRLLLIVDQAEELFLQADRAQASAFIDNLLHAIALPQGRVTAVLTLRADFLGPCLERPALAEQVRATMTLVLPMTREDLREAILGPAQLVGLLFEEGLVDALLDAILDTEPAATAPSSASPEAPKRPDREEYGPGALSSGILPLLQFTLDQLWEWRSGALIAWQAWRAIGGVRGAIARRADEVLASAAQAGEQELVRQLFGRLVHLGDGTVDARRRAPREEIEAIAPGRMQSVVDRWIKARMLIADAAEVTLAHEALLREWGTLRRWIDENRDSLRILNLLSRDARRYFDSGQNEDDLWHGTRLRRALALRAQGRLHLSAAETAFLSRSAEAAARQQALAEQQQRQAQDNDPKVGAVGRSLAVLSLIVLGSASYFLALWLAPTITHQLFMTQTVGLVVASLILRYFLRNKLAANRVNLRLAMMCFSVTVPVFINHVLGWRFGWSIAATQVLHLNTFVAASLVGAIALDRRLVSISVNSLAFLLFGCFFPRRADLIFAAAATLGFVIMFLVLRNSEDRAPPSPARANESYVGPP